MFARLLAAASLLAAAGSAPAQPTAADGQAEWAQQCKDWDDWDKPGPPFHVFGNTYYVGTCGISAILITTAEGDILIDGGPANAGSLVARNIEALGFPLSDVKMITHSHEHHDHVGGLAELQRLTGAEVFASPAAAKALTSGTATKDDPQFEEHGSFPPVAARDFSQRNPAVSIGDLKLHAIETPGHTPGALSWQWQSCGEAGRCKTIVYADSLTPVSSDSYKFSDHRELVAAFNNSLVRVGSLRCDILLSPHPSASDMRSRLLAGNLLDTKACFRYANALKQRLDARLAQEENAG
jgi:metallo-beta-lactamase class B